MQTLPIGNVCGQPGGILIPHEIGGLTVYQRKSDRYVNATAMCQAAGKLICHWSENDNTEKDIAALSGVYGNSRRPLGEHDHDGSQRRALHLANWCSPEFDSAVISWTGDEWNGGKHFEGERKYKPGPLRTKLSRSFSATV